mmetsp:Transcript_56826/g.122881  ORF Transcript_56826/g.122881 Transcript_56826/m.122881 type:complete len:505 (-) Transcript_56826:121-1635(-)
MAEVPSGPVVALERAGKGAPLQDFVQQHLTGILQPFAEHFHELQGQLEQLAKDLVHNNEAIERVDKRASRVEDHGAALKTDLDHLQRALQDVRVEFGQVHHKHEDLIVDHDATKVALKRVDGHLHSTSLSAQMARTQLEAHEKCFRSLEGSIEDGKKATSCVDARVSELWALHSISQEAHQELAQRLSEEKLLAEQRQLLFVEHQATVEQQQARAWLEHQKLADRIQELEPALEKLELRIAEDAASLAANVANVEELERLVSSIEEALELQGEDMAKAMTETGAEAKSIGDRLNRKMEEGLSRLTKEFPIAVKKMVMELTQPLVDAIDGHSSDLDKQARDITNLSEVHKGHGELILRVDRHSGQLDGRLSELSKQAEVAGAQIKGLTASQKAAASRVEALEHELDKTNRGLQQAHSHLEAADSGASALSGDMTLLKEAWARVSARLDLAHDYVEGVGKGLQDAHRLVITGQEGMLPPRSNSRVRALPALEAALGSAPRTPPGRP